MMRFSAGLLGLVGGIAATPVLALGIVIGPPSYPAFSYHLNDFESSYPPHASGTTAGSFTLNGSRADLGLTPSPFVRVSIAAPVNNFAVASGSVDYQYFIGIVAPSVALVAGTHYASLVHVAGALGYAVDGLWDHEYAYAYVKADGQKTGFDGPIGANSRAMTFGIDAGGVFDQYLTSSSGDVYALFTGVVSVNAGVGTLVSHGDQVLSAFVDPVITLDPGLAARFGGSTTTLTFSPGVGNAPATVAEPTPVFALLLGTGVLAARRRRARRTH